MFGKDWENMMSKGGSKNQKTEITFFEDIGADENYAGMIPQGHLPAIRGSQRTLRKGQQVPDILFIPPDLQLKDIRLVAGTFQGM